jgi:hypothetical protein
MIPYENILTDWCRVCVERHESPHDIYDHLLTFYPFYGGRPFVIKTILDPLPVEERYHHLSLLVGHAISLRFTSSERVLATPLTDTEKDDILYTSWERGITNPLELLEKFEILVPEGDEEDGVNLSSTARTK